MAQASTNAPTTFEELKDILSDDDKVQASAERLIYDVAGVDVDGILRGKIMTKEKFLSACKAGGFGFCSVVFGWDMHDQAYPNELKISNLENGYRDLNARIDFNTYRRTPTEPSLPFFLVTFLEPDTGDTLSACPRGTLQRIIAELEASGFEAYAGAEYEYFQFRETPDSVAAKDFHNLQPLTSGMHGYSLLRPELNSEYFHALYDNCAKFGIPLEGHHTETGPGVFESALAYQSVLRMADNATLFKWVAKTTGYKFGVMPTFMAKPYSNQPGCSGHVHISLRDAKTGKNIFAVDEADLKTGRSDALYDDTKRISKIAEHFLAGVLKGLPDIMPCLLPNVNGYKRLVESYWAPVNVSYAYESRVASVRIISPPLADPAATRLEVRVPGADMNPYLTFAAVIACGLQGIKQSLPLTLKPLKTIQGQKPKLERLPKTLQEATIKMANKDSVARQVLGDEFVDHFVGTRQHEWNLFASAVTDWELKRYLELA
ncbi:hypothetical protein OIO90_000597 [Microbotryomycetes sp. JL221]|nr:hypothetical protein OIO90_000597 [Microbotryomycetes sp. JL221]